MGKYKKVSVPEILNFDPKKYMGIWYEIARKDFRFERNIEQTTAQYALRSDGNIDVLNRGFDFVNQAWKEAKAVAKPGKYKNYLRVFFNPFIAGKYRLAYVDPDYTYAVVSGATTKYLWFLSRTPKVSREQLNKMLAVAHALGQDTENLVFPKQN